MQRSKESGPRCVPLKGSEISGIECGDSASVFRRTVLDDLARARTCAVGDKSMCIRQGDTPFVRVVALTQSRWASIIKFNFCQPPTLAL